MGVSVKKFGISLSPSPSLLLLYTEEGKTRRREMPLRDLRADSDCRALVSRLKLRHPCLGSIPPVRLERVLLLVREQMRGSSLHQAIETVDSLLRGDPMEDLNKLSDTELQRRKDLMDLAFEKNKKGKDDPDFVYDKQVDFGSAREAAKGWDDSQASEASEACQPRYDEDDRDFRDDTEASESPRDDEDDNEASELTPRNIEIGQPKEGELSVPEDTEEDFW